MQNETKIVLIVVAYLRKAQRSNIALELVDYTGWKNIWHGKLSKANLNINRLFAQIWSKFW